MKIFRKNTKLKFSYESFYCNEFYEIDVYVIYKNKILKIESDNNAVDLKCSHF